MSYVNSYWLPFLARVSIARSSSARTKTKPWEHRGRYEKAASRPMCRESDYPKHNGHLHQFGWPRACAWANPKCADDSKQTASEQISNHRMQTQQRPSSEYLSTDCYSVGTRLLVELSNRSGKPSNGPLPLATLSKTLNNISFHGVPLIEQCEKAGDQVAQYQVEAP